MRKYIGFEEIPTGQNISCWARSPEGSILFIFAKISVRKNIQENISSLKKDVFLKEYRNCPHGLWSLDTNCGMEEAKFIITETAEMICKIIEEKQKTIEIKIC